MAMGAAKIRGLLQWCKQQVEGYPGVEVSNFTKSFRDGLAFCAIIHRFRPELLDFYTLSKENVLDNNQLAYSVAESELGIPALLDAEDMVAVTVPDRLSVITYVSQYYNYFCNKTPMGGPNVVAAEPSRISMRKKKQPSVQPPSPAPVEVHGPELCAICHKTVYMLERHHLDDQLVHRSCLRRNQMKDIGERVKSLERGAHLKRNLCSIGNSVKEHEGGASEREEGVSASKRRTSPSRTSASIQPKAPEPSVRHNGTTRHQPNNFVGQPSPVIPPISDVPSAPAAAPVKEKTSTPPRRALSPSEGKPIPRPRSPAVPTPPVPPNLHLLQTESSNEQRQSSEKSNSESSLLRSRSPTPRLSKADSMSHSHHKRRAPAPPPHPTPPSRPPTSYSTAPPRPPSIRTLPVELPPASRASAELEQDSYPESLNPFCEPAEPSSLPASASIDSLPPAKPSSPKITVRLVKDVPSDAKEPVLRHDPREEDVSFEYHGKNPFDMDDDDVEDSVPAGATSGAASTSVAAGGLEQPKAPPLPPPPSVPPTKTEDGDVSFEYRGKNPFDMDSDDDTGSHDLSSTSGSSLRTSVMRKKRHAPPPPPRPVNSSVAAADENGSLNRSEKNNGVSPAPEPPTNEISPSSTNSGNDISLTEAASEPPSGRKRITVLPDDELQPAAANARVLRPIRPLDNFHFSSDENEDADTESASANEAPGADKTTEAALGDTDQETGSTHTNDSNHARKGPAPAQPVLGRRCVRTDADEEYVPYAELIAELERLNEEQVQMEKRGRQIEEDLRKSERRGSPGHEDAEVVADSDAKVDDLMVSWLELIEQKNQLFRRENELHYRIRQRELEERHADIEYELRQLLAKQEHVKTEADRTREGVLLQDLQTCVMERSELVYALDEDQQRNFEDDKHRTRVLGPKFTNVLCISSKSKKKHKDWKKKEKKEKKKDKEKKKTK